MEYKIETIEKDQEQKQPTEYLATDQQKIVLPQNINSDVKYAGFWIRYAAVFIDGLILSIPGGVIMGILKDSPAEMVAILAYYVIMWSYYIFMTKKYGATFGKKALGIKVVSDKSEDLSWGQLILRETIGKIISGLVLAIGYIMAGFTERKQALHDKISGTVVVYNNPNKKIPTWVMIIVLILPTMAVFGIVATIALSGLGSARDKAAETSLKSMESMEQYSAENQSEDLVSSTEVSKINDEYALNIYKDGTLKAIILSIVIDFDKWKVENLGYDGFVENKINSNKIDSEIEKINKVGKIKVEYSIHSTENDYVLKFKDSGDGAFYCTDAYLINNSENQTDMIKVIDIVENNFSEATNCINELLRK